MGRHEVCVGCGAWRELDGSWTRPTIIEHVALEGVLAEREPPGQEASTLVVEGRLEATPNVDGTVTVVLHGDHGLASWRYVRAQEAAEYAHALLKAAGASTAGIPTPEVFAFDSPGRREPESPAPLRGIVSEAIGATMRPTFLAGWLWAVGTQVVEEMPGSDEYVGALARLRRALDVVEKELGCAPGGACDTMPPAAGANGEASP